MKAQYFFSNLVYSIYVEELKYKGAIISLHINGLRKYKIRNTFSKSLKGQDPKWQLSYFIPGITKKKRIVGLERGPLSLVSTTEELLDRKVAAPV
jgi:hypothetical protein